MLYLKGNTYQREWKPFGKSRQEATQGTLIDPDQLTPNARLVKLSTSEQNTTANRPKLNSNRFKNVFVNRLIFKYNL